MNEKADIKYLLLCLFVGLNSFVWVYIPEWHLRILTVGIEACVIWLMQYEQQLSEQVKKTGK